MKQNDIQESIQNKLNANKSSRLAASRFTEAKGFIDSLNELPSNDLDAATFLAREFASLFTYIPTTATKGEWYFWNGAIHEKHTLNQIDDYLATALADYLRDASKDLDGHWACLTESERKKSESDFKGLKSYARSIRSAGPLRNLKSRLNLILTKPVDYFDNDSRWAVLADGQVLDLTNMDGELLPPDSTRPVSRALGVTYDHGMSYPSKWITSLDQWVPDREVQEFLQIAAGAALLGQGDAKNIVALVGVSNTGKSTYINILKEVFGGYAGALPATAIVQKYGGASNFEQSRARGKRFLYLSEPQAQRTDDAFLKNLAGGGETITTAEKGKDSVEWNAQCVLHIASNHTPKFDTNDNAIVERMNLVGFDHIFARDKSGSADTFAKDIVREEGSAIFIWIVEGATRYQEMGFIPVPETIRRKSDGNVVAASVALRWLKEVTDDGRYYIATGEPMSLYVKPVDLYPEFIEWCIKTGEKSVSQAIWLAEIERFNGMPVEKKGKRPNGFARVYGVVSVQDSDELSKKTPKSPPPRRSIVTWAERLDAANAQ